jgi:hypothetical protein
VPSELDDFYWSVSYRDVRTKVKLTLGLEQARATQEYQSMADIISKALGGEDKNKSKGQTPQNFEQAQSQLSAALGKK